MQVSNQALIEGRDMNDLRRHIGYKGILLNKDGFSFVGALYRPPWPFPNITHLKGILYPNRFANETVRYDVFNVEHTLIAIYYF